MERQISDHESMRALFLWGVLCVLWMGVIFALSQQSALGNNPTTFDLWFYIERKGAHVVEYMILAFLCAQFFAALGFCKRRIIVFSVLITLLYAFSDEVHQTFIPGREGRLRDVAIDSIGMMFGLLMWAWWHAYCCCTKKAKTNSSTTA